ncbi:amylo-alpha-1,6-glucosidase [Motilibacter aurantiacus]|uniref:amylo-alpha-1,6-glucosidase n=1 Tax=Motilibacter aurantiacus TaxID=2714955 RepID=UPI00140C7183|nr:glycogen debranching N-terminal domain-containing protein [Motilibacter aurantiacus]NHC47189.1 amylo-alpha-1,6-glucosidase [Motilibacter aurantiacus]
MTEPDLSVLRAEQLPHDADPTEASAPSPGDVTVVEGSSFCVSDRAGDITPDRPQGVFFRDNRIVSTWRLLVDDLPLEPLSVVFGEPFEATFLTRAAPRPGCHDASLVVERRRMVANGLREDLVVHNYGREPAGISIQLLVDADFADLFDVKDGRPRRVPAVDRRCSGDQLELVAGTGSRRRGTRVRAAGATAVPGALAWRVIVPPHGQWRASVEVFASSDGHEEASAFPLDQPVEQARPTLRMQDWRSTTPELHCGSSALARAVDRSVLDLGALRIQDPERPGSDVVAAGAPWFMALFGRDALLTSWMALPFDPGLALSTLQTLARHQGAVVDPMSEEEPGKILHEVRLGMDESRALGGSSVYYGSVDSTPLFVMLLDQVARWGAPLADVERLLPAADRALGWVERFGDVDGDGFVEYARKTDRGLLNQGWKDSLDSIAFADGRLAEPPIALVEAQGYVYAAYLARAHLARVFASTGEEGSWRERAEELRRRFNERFWLPEHGHYALALDAEKRPVDSLASNQGHCLWTGIVTEDRARAVAAHLLSPAMFSGWGVRTLATSAATFNPVSYHNGSVWPHDNAVLVAGLVRYGLVPEAQRVASALVAASASFGGRLPELFCGFDRGSVPRPVPYPTSCSPQAWSAATPISLLTSLLRIDVCLPHGRAAAHPVTPREWGRVRLAGVPLGESRVDVDSETPSPGLLGRTAAGPPA